MIKIKIVKKGMMAGYGTYDHLAETSSDMQILLRSISMKNKLESNNCEDLESTIDLSSAVMNGSTESGDRIQSIHLKPKLSARKMSFKPVIQ